MLPSYIQKRLVENFINPHHSSEALNENFSLQPDLMKKIDGKVAYSCVAYIDISGFSTKINGWSTQKIKTYLTEYYDKVLPIIGRHKGKIDRIMGDGIITVFSTVFDDIKTDKGAVENCVNCCYECVQEFYAKTELEVKAAIGDGDLYFCNIGIKNIYEELTCIGHPLTVAYRLESVAEKNQILFLKDSEIYNLYNSVLPSYCFGESHSKHFQGLGQKEFYLWEYDIDSFVANEL